MSSNLKSTVLSTVLHQNQNRVTTIADAFNTTAPQVNQYLISQIRAILPNASNISDDTVLYIAYLKACIDNNIPTGYDVTAGSNKISLGGTPLGAALQAFSIDVDEGNIDINALNGVLGISKGGTNLTALGTSLQYLRVNTLGTALEYATFPTIPTVTPSNVTAGSTKISLGGTPTGAALQAFSVDVVEANLTLNNIGGTLGISKGGTNLTALGTANQLIRVNAGATALEYFTPTYGSGTVTSIATSGLISGGTITSSGTITTSVSTNKLIGRATAGTGVMEEITLGTGLSFTGTTLNATGGTTTLVVGTTPITSGTIGRVLFQGTGNVLQQNAILNLDTTNGLIIGGATARGTRLTLVNSSDTATVKNIVVRNAADSTDRLIVYGDGNIKSLPSNTNFNASNELQLHIENTDVSAFNVGISFKGSNSHTFITNNQADQSLNMGQVVSGIPERVLSFRYASSFRGAQFRCKSGVGFGSTGISILNTDPNREWGVLVGNTSNAVLGTGGLGLFDVTSGTFGLTLNGSTLNVGVGSILATARLHIRAGSATANTAPLKFTTGTNLTTAEAGAMEYNNTFHLTNSDATRRHVVLSAANAKTIAVSVVDGFITMNIGGNDIKIATVA